MSVAEQVPPFSQGSEHVGAEFGWGYFALILKLPLDVQASPIENKDPEK